MTPNPVQAMADFTAGILISPKLPGYKVSSASPTTSQRLLQAELTHTPLYTRLNGLFTWINAKDVNRYEYSIKMSHVTKKHIPGCHFTSALPVCVVKSHACHRSLQHRLEVASLSSNMQIIVTC